MCVCVSEINLICNTFSIRDCCSPLHTHLEKCFVVTITTITTLHTYNYISLNGLLSFNFVKWGQFIHITKRLVIFFSLCRFIIIRYSVIIFYYKSYSALSFDKTSVEFTSHYVHSAPTHYNAVSTELCNELIRFTATNAYTHSVYKVIF